MFITNANDNHGVADNKASNSNQTLWTLSFILICLSSLTIMVAFHILLPTLPMYIQQYGGSQEIAGWALAALTIAAVIIRPIAGWTMDRFGRKLILIIGLMAFMIPSLIYILMVPIIPLILLRFFQGLGWGIGTTAQGTVASDIIPQRRMGEGLGFFSLAASLSLAASPGIGLWLVDIFSFQILFITSSILTLISLILALLIKYPKLHIPTAPKRLVFMERTVIRPAAIMLLVAATYSSLLSFLVLFVQQQGMTTAGVFFTALAITTFLSRPFSGIIIDKHGKSGYDLVVLVGLVTIIVSMLILAQTTSIWYLIFGGISFGIGFGFVQHTMLVLCVNSVPQDRRGAANASYWTAFDTGVALGSILWGIIAKNFGYTFMFNLTSVPPILALLLYLANIKSEKSSKIQAGISTPSES